MYNLIASSDQANCHIKLIKICKIVGDYSVTRFAIDRAFSDCQTNASCEKKTFDELVLQSGRVKSGCFFLVLLK